MDKLELKNRPEAVEKENFLYNFSRNNGLWMWHIILQQFQLLTTSHISDLFC